MKSNISLLLLFCACGFGPAEGPVAVEPTASVRLNDVGALIGETAVLVRDGSGRLHDGVALVPASGLHNVEAFLEDTRVILASDESFQLRNRSVDMRLVETRPAFETRLAQARADLTKLLDTNPSQAFFALVFREANVVGWEGRAVPASYVSGQLPIPNKTSKTKGYVTYSFGLDTGGGSTSTPNYYCVAGSSAGGNTCVNSAVNGTVKRINNGSFVDQTSTGNYPSLWSLPGTYTANLAVHLELTSSGFTCTTGTFWCYNYNP